MAFMPFVTAGDPDFSTTVEMIRLLRDCGVDLIEVGFPYSDPIADGPVIQASYTRALANKIRLPDIFGGAEGACRANRSLRSLAMVAYAIVYRAGPERVLQQARRGRLFGTDRARSSRATRRVPCSKLARSQGLDLVSLVAPTTTSDARRADFAVNERLCVLPVGCRHDRASAKHCPKNWRSNWPNSNRRQSCRWPLGSESAGRNRSIRSAAWPTA